MASRPPPRFIVRRHDEAAIRRRWYGLAGGWVASLIATGLIVGLLTGGGSPINNHNDKRQLRELTAQNDDLRQQVANLERDQQVNDIAAKAVQSSLADREEEINGLRADLGFYSRLMGGDDAQRQGLKVQELKLKAVQGSPHAWDIDLSLTQSAKRASDVSGKLSISLDGVRGDKVVQLDWATLSAATQKDGIPFRFKYFQQLHATFALPADFKPTRVRIKVSPDGESTINRTITWADAMAGNLSNVQGDKDAQP